MASIKLTEDLLHHFNISDYSPPKKGGQKTVFIVTIENIKYALKIINSVDARFEREVKICAKYSINNGIPKIIRIDNYGTETIILEEFIEGNDLSEINLQYKGNEPKICKLLHQIGIILKPIWEDNYVHRDLKPQNIRIRRNWEPVILDFGIARALNEHSLTDSISQPLSWPFASPEQYAGRKDLISYRTDFFCLGIIGYYLFSNKFPFGKTKEEIDSKFQLGNLEVNLSSLKLTNFCNAVFKINPSGRPRKIEKLLKFLEA